MDRFSLIVLQNDRSQIRRLFRDRPNIITLSGWIIAFTLTIYLVWFEFRPTICEAITDIDTNDCIYLTSKYGNQLGLLISEQNQCFTTGNLYTIPRVSPNLGL